MTDLVPVPITATADTAMLAARAAELEAAADRLAALDTAATQYVRRPRETARAYATDWRAWHRYCAEVGIPDSATTIGALVGFAAWHIHRELAPATIERRIFGVVVCQRDRANPVPEDVLAAATLALDRHRTDLAEQGLRRGRGSAPALTVRDLRTISAALPDTLTGTRDRAVLLLGFAIAARRSELASLDVSDIAPVPEGVLVSVRFGKTGARTVAVGPGTHTLTCPVTAIQAWITAAGLTEGPLFRPITRHGHLLDQRLSGRSLGEIVTRAGTTAGLTAAFTGHSVRSGLATEARRAGHDAKTIATQGGWRPQLRRALPLHADRRPVERQRPQRHRPLKTLRRCPQHLDRAVATGQ